MTLIRTLLGDCWWYLSTDRDGVVFISTDLNLAIPCENNEIAREKIRDCRQDPLLKKYSFETDELKRTVKSE